MGDVEVEIVACFELVLANAAHLGFWLDFHQNELKQRVEGVLADVVQMAVLLFAALFFA